MCSRGDRATALSRVPCSGERESDSATLCVSACAQDNRAVPYVIAGGGAICADVCVGQERAREDSGQFPVPVRREGVGCACAC